MSNESLEISLKFWLSNHGHVKHCFVLPITTAWRFFFCKVKHDLATNFISSGKTFFTLERKGRLDYDVDHAPCKL